MVTLYETERGDFAPASALTADEAVSAFRAGHLLAADVHALSAEALTAVVRAFTGFELRVERGSVWGRRAGDDRPVIVVEGVQ